MIVNEKYIRDIEDEDDDIAVDDGIISNGNKSYDFEVMVNMTEKSDCGDMVRYRVNYQTLQLL